MGSMHDLKALSALLTCQNRDSISLTESVEDFPHEFGRTYHAYQAGCKELRLSYPNQATGADLASVAHHTLLQWVNSS
jgi:hypothetical protein